MNRVRDYAQFERFPHITAQHKTASGVKERRLLFYVAQIK